MEIDLDLDTIGSEMVKILRQLKKQRQSVRPKFLPGRQDNKKKIKKEGNKSKQRQKQIIARLRLR